MEPNFAQKLALIYIKTYLKITYLKIVHNYKILNIVINLWRKMDTGNDVQLTVDDG